MFDHIVLTLSLFVRIFFFFRIVSLFKMSWLSLDVVSYVSYCTATVGIIGSGFIILTYAMFLNHLQ